jgi:hypothetical protein
MTIPRGSRPIRSSAAIALRGMPSNLADEGSCAKVMPLSAFTAFSLRVPSDTVPVAQHFQPHTGRHDDVIRLDSRSSADLHYRHPGCLGQQRGQVAVSSHDEIFQQPVVSQRRLAASNFSRAFRMNLTSRRTWRLRYWAGVDSFWFLAKLLKNKWRRDRDSNPG